MRNLSGMDSSSGQSMRLLSLDGGGIRGLSSLYILQNIMEKIRFIYDYDTEPLPCDHFDLICGTSTGGIIALMLGRLRMSVSECINSYLEMSQRVFGQPNNITHREKFDPIALERAVQDIVERRLGDRNAPLLDPTCCKTFVCTYDKKALGGSPTLLRTYKTGSALIPCTIWEAARATSAAPTFFPSIQFGGIHYIDAGIGCNNPTKIILKEAKSYYRTRNYPATTPTCIVSLGTGQKDIIRLHKAASAFWFKDRVGLSVAPALADIVTDCENTHDEVTLMCIDGNMADRYYRFNVPQGMQKIVLDEWEKADDIKTYTSKYLSLNQTEHDMERCVKNIRSGLASNPGIGESDQDNRDGIAGDRLYVTQGDNTQYGSISAVNSHVFLGNSAGFNFDHFGKGR